MEGIIYMFCIYTFLGLGIFGFTYKAIFAASIGMNVFYTAWLIIHCIKEARDEAKNPNDIGYRLRRIMREQEKQKPKKKGKKNGKNRK